MGLSQHLLSSSVLSGSEDAGGQDPVVVVGGGARVKREISIKTGSWTAAPPAQEASPGQSEASRGRNTPSDDAGKPRTPSQSQSFPLKNISGPSTCPGWRRHEGGAGKARPCRECQRAQAGRRSSQQESPNLRTGGTCVLGCTVDPVGHQ